jgi:hypothetical protein
MAPIRNPTFFFRNPTLKSWILNFLYKNKLDFNCVGFQIPFFKNIFEPNYSLIKK